MEWILHRNGYERNGYVGDRNIKKPYRSIQLHITLPICCIMIFNFSQFHVVHHSPSGCYAHIHRPERRICARPNPVPVHSYMTWIFKRYDFSSSFSITQFLFLFNFHSVSRNFRHYELLCPWCIPFLFFPFLLFRYECAFYGNAGLYRLSGRGPASRFTRARPTGFAFIQWKMVAATATDGLHTCLAIVHKNWNQKRNRVKSWIVSKNLKQ